MRKSLEEESKVFGKEIEHESNSPNQRTPGAVYTVHCSIH